MSQSLAETNLAVFMQGFNTFACPDSGTYANCLPDLYGGTEASRAAAAQGLVERLLIGDRYVARLTTAGRQFLAI